MNAPRGTRLILEAQQEVGVIEEFAIQNFERHGAVSYPNLLSQENRAHAPRAQAADNAETSRQSGRKLRLGFCGPGGKGSAVAGTESKIVRITPLASRTGFHGRP
jgi:hypothetical protein